MIPSRIPIGLVFCPTSYASFDLDPGLDPPVFFFLAAAAPRPLVAAAPRAGRLDAADVAAALGSDAATGRLVPGGVGAPALGRRAGAGASTASPSTTIRMWLGRFKIGVARPCAPGGNRFKVGPACATASF